MVGDLANGRTVRSLCMCLAMYDNVEIFFVAPEVVRMRDDIKVRRKWNRSRKRSRNRAFRPRFDAAAWRAGTWLAGGA